MNPHYHHTWTAESKLTVTPEGDIVPEVFWLELRYRPGGEPHRYDHVHIPKALQPTLASGEVKGVYIETLGFDGLASRCLPNAPEYIVTGLITRDGNKLTAVPEALKWARLFCLGAGTVACAIGIPLLVASPAWLGAIFLVIGTHCWRTAAHVPCSANLEGKELPPDGPVFVGVPL